MSSPQSPNPTPNPLKPNTIHAKNTLHVYWVDLSIMEIEPKTKAATLEIPKLNRLNTLQTGFNRINTLAQSKQH
jgi:hypothetical protein